MGADVFEAHRELLGSTANQILGWSLEEMCLEGPAEELTRTEHAQPALFAVAYATWISFRQRVGISPSVAAGHSLGEYTALAAAGSLTFEDGLRLVAERGRFMAEAADAAPSGMAALLGADRATADLVVQTSESQGGTLQIAAEAADAAPSGMAALLGADRATADLVVQTSESQGGTLQIANLNAPGQIVVAGSDADLDWLESNARDLGVRRAVRLKVAGAFHSSYMSSAADKLAKVIEGVQFSTPEFDVVANASASPHEPEQIGNALVEQVVSPVQFESSLEAIETSGVDVFVHIGPGDVTAGLAKRTVPDAQVFTVSKMDDIDPVAESLGTMV
ncbi:MAG: ACP S-malonyltransferase [Actinobacteria bacterium]|nr:MAG: ACP S-malonyltransferase [Actinomycetota bacterium]